MLSRSDASQAGLSALDARALFRPRGVFCAVDQNRDVPLGVDRDDISLIRSQYAASVARKTPDVPEVSGYARDSAGRLINQDWVKR